MTTKTKNMYPTEIKVKLDNIFSKLELFYPEKKIFSFDSLCGKQREKLSAIATELGTNYNQIIREYGYEIITRNEALLIRSSVIYTPGNEPDLIKNRLSNILEALSTYYPQKIIEISIDKEHKKLANTISGFAIWLGYKTTVDFLSAYGYFYSIKSKDEHLENNALQILELLKSKYLSASSRPNSITELESENPAFVEAIHYLQRNSRKMFGCSISKYLLSIGVLGIRALPNHTIKNSKKIFKSTSRTKVVELHEIYESSEYLKYYNELKWIDSSAPRYNRNYIKITPKIIAVMKYSCTCKNYGTTPIAKLEEITVAFRDGVTEYALIKEKLNELKAQRVTVKNSDKLDEQIEWLKYLNRNIECILPQFSKHFAFNTGEQLCLESITIDKTKISNSSIASQYVVLDLETNGLRTANDDLLSISLYDPSVGKIYHRLLPLELQPTVLTTYINGIDDADVENAVPLCQKEFDDLIAEFNLTNKTILFYSGGKFDFDFLDKYCRRHKITGMDLLRFENIKNRIASSSYTTGNITKDNLCNALGIQGVSEIHSGVNDCYLEWKLFEQFVCDKLLIKNNYIYKYSDDYVIPASYLTSFPKLAEFAKVEVPKLSYQNSLLYEYYLPSKLTKKIRKFPTNISGISIENIINSMIGAKECDNRDFLNANNRKLKIVGEFPSEYEEIPVIKREDGTLKSLAPQYEEYIKAVNETSNVIRSGISDVIDFIREKIFANKEIRTQEISFAENHKVLALCDLSSDDAVLEIKTFDIFNSYKTENVIRQMYYQKGDKALYAMSIIFEFSCTKKKERRLENLIFKIYKVEIEKER